MLTRIIALPSRVTSPDSFVVRVFIATLTQCSFRHTFATSMSSVGPQIPGQLLPTVSAATTGNDAAESDEDDYTPALPPELVAARKAAGPSSEPTPGPSTRRSSSPLPPPPRRVIGPTFPTTAPPRRDFDSDSDSDAEVGPQPLPADVAARTRDISGVEAFLEREARRRKNVEEAKQPKKLVREEWMLVPPKAGDLLSCTSFFRLADVRTNDDHVALDPTKLKARQFGRGTAPARDSDTSLWTETPAERQQRLADEVSGRKRRVVNAEPVEDEEEARKRQRRDAEVRKGVDRHTVRLRSSGFVFMLLVHSMPPMQNSAKCEDLRLSMYTWNARAEGRIQTQTSLLPPSGIIHGTCRLADVSWMTNNGKSCCTMPRALEIALG